MKVHFLFAVVAVQIGIFQFLSLRFLRAIPYYLLGGAEAPCGVESAVNDYRRGMRRWNYALGAALLGGMTLFAYVLPFTRGAPAVLSIAAASILSSGCFLWAYLRARAGAQRIVDLLPDTGMRVASLDRRELGHYYNVAWEIVPFLMLAGSAVLTLWALPRLGQPYPLGFDARGIPDQWGEGTGRFLAVLGLQAACAFGFLLLTIWGLRSKPCLSPRAPAAARDPEQAERMIEEVRSRKLRFFMLAKVALGAQLALILFVKIETALGVALPVWAKESPWAATLFLLSMFVIFVRRMARDRRLSS